MVEQSNPDQISNESQLDDLLGSPQSELVHLMRQLDGDLIVLGIAGKMGVSLGQLAVEAIRQSGVSRTVYGVARFSDNTQRDKLAAMGIETIRCDLLDRADVATLPTAKNVIFMAGLKFGTSTSPAMTWAANTLIPANVAEHYRDSRIVAFSTGCVYPLVRRDDACNEDVPPAPIGEYAQSCLGRERVFQYSSEAFRTKTCLVRLNYSIDLRYGVLYDIGEKVWRGEPVNNGVKAFNVIWQGDANHQALLCLNQCSIPANILNVTGPETLLTEDVARRFGQLMNKPVAFSTTPSERSYLNDSERARDLFGPPTVSADQLIRWQADWIMRGGRSLNKPTHFEVSDGDY